jgi:zinc transport system substrate-binding protein
VWLDPVLWSRAVDVIADAIVDAGVPLDEGLAEAFRGEMEALHQEFRSGLSRCARDLIVTSHDAFGRLAERYGLRVEPIAGVSPESEPDPARLDELAELVEREGVTTIFTETLVSPEVAETLAREVGVRTDVLDPVEGVAPEREGTATYFSLMRENLEALREALGCE